MCSMLRVCVYVESIRSIYFWHAETKTHAYHNESKNEETEDENII